MTYFFFVDPDIRRNDFKRSNLNRKKKLDKNRFESCFKKRKEKGKKKGMRD